MCTSVCDDISFDPFMGKTSKFMDLLDLHLKSYNKQTICNTINNMTLMPYSEGVSNLVFCGKICQFLTADI